MKLAMEDRLLVSVYDSWALLEAARFYAKGVDGLI